MNKKTKNQLSLFLGIILILAGLTQTAINFSKFGLDWLSIPPAFSLVIGAILTIMGGTKSW